MCGIVFRLKQGTLSPVPLEEVCVQGVIIDVSAKVTLTQVFTNPSDHPTSRAKYVFPIPARAAVCAFELRMDDGHTIVGIAKERQQAAMDHATAIRQGKATSLVEWATDDAFTISIGSIPAKQKITTKLTYTINLMNDDLVDQIRFQLPMSIGERYGVMPTTMMDASAPAPSTRVRVMLGIQTSGDIQSVTSPSHPEVTCCPFDSGNGEPSRNRMITTYESREYLTRDFIVNIQARGLDEPRCFAERDPRHESVSLQLTLIPKFNLPPIATQEYIFLVDRSGSMAGSRIETARRTLMMLLRLLPTSGTTFNIFSFGSKSSSISVSSLPYSQATLADATQYADSMQADFGGTNIVGALSSVFQSRTRTCATAVFVLTDGKAHSIDATIEGVTNAVACSTKEAPLRVFTLGIGESASSAMCEGIARAGNGICLMAETSENILGKCAKLVRASRTFILKNITVDWGIPPAGEQPSPLVLQAPHKIEAIYPGHRLLVSAMIKDPGFSLPRHVVLRGQRDGEGEPIEIRVKVDTVDPFEDDDTTPLVNTLAAHRMIAELEDPRNRLFDDEEQKKATIIRIGEQYQLTSRYTSFVAVGELLSSYSKEPATESTPGESFSTLATNSFGDTSTSTDKPSTERRQGSWEDTEDDWDFGHPDPTPADPSPVDPARRGRARGRARLLIVSESPPTKGVLGEGYSSVLRRKIAGNAPLPIPRERDRERQQPQDLLNASSGGPVVQAPTSSSASGYGPRIQTAVPQPQTIGFTSDTSSEAVKPTSNLPIETPVVRMVRLQAFDGSFYPSDEFVQIVGKEDIITTGRAKGVDHSVWATIVAIVYLNKHLSDQRELLDGLVEKAMEFIQCTP